MGTFSESAFALVQRFRRIKLTARYPPRKKVSKRTFSRGSLFPTLPNPSTFDFFLLFITVPLD
jgi:hypothetical protein